MRSGYTLVEILVSFIVLIAVLGIFFIVSTYSIRTLNIVKDFGEYSYLLSTMKSRITNLLLFASDATAVDTYPPLGNQCVLYREGNSLIFECSDGEKIYLSDDISDATFIVKTFSAKDKPRKIVVFHIGVLTPFEGQTRVSFSVPLMNSHRSSGSISEGQYLLIEYIEY
ncbi:MULTISPECIES: hypothetical protein [unclassified Thermotoga]|uniref:hypothetical protein n=1 Tax=unclassified Thermotoga TaxID=2631113 RepID=UPI000280E9D9|nr:MULTISPECIES: hypothetical protein [unclassified Thermotoga]AIY87198.1 hypothetical protein T2812B_08375 [Thermotoga sp. 2812B]EJX25285.1 hypothetical protein EMP_09064 [Thermotoga sp. EMP]